MITSASASPMAPDGRHADPIGVDASTHWLVLAWQDLKAAPAYSLGFGAFYAAGAWLLTLAAVTLGLGSVVLPLAAGFMLVGPFLALGLYEVSRRRERGELLELTGILTCWRRNAPQIGLVALALMLLLFAWMQLAFLIFMLFYGDRPPQLDNFVSALLAAPQAPLFLAVGTAVGGVLAAVAFGLSAFSMPMLLDRDVNAMEAMTCSLRAARRNWRTMSGWAATLALLTFAGMVPGFLGLIVTLPLAGHASWHAYRAMCAAHGGQMPHR